MRVCEMQRRVRVCVCVLGLEYSPCISNQALSPGAGHQTGCLLSAQSSESPAPVPRPSPCHEIELCKILNFYNITLLLPKIF